MGLFVFSTILLFTGTVVAVFPLTGIGGFIISAKEISGTGFSLYPTISDRSEKEKWPQAAIGMKTATIKGLNLAKELNVSNMLGSYGIERGKVVIGATGDAGEKQLKLRVSSLGAQNATFDNLNVSEHYSDDPLKKFNLTAPGLVLTAPELNTHSRMANKIGLPGLTLNVEAYDKNGNLMGGEAKKEVEKEARK